MTAMKPIRCLICLLVLGLAPGCIRTKHDVNMNMKVEPIHITVDVNLKIEKELDDFFGDIDAADPTQSKKQ